MSSTKNANGLLPVPASVIKKPAATVPPTKGPAKAATPRLRLIVRRLPPGLTQEEFESALGDEWRMGGGQVDWFAFKEGKISKDLSKPSKPARAYLRVREQSYLEALSVKIKQTTIQDAKNTTKDPSLLGPPSLEFAPYGRAPSSRIRKDGRQGTIDQDPEFIDFLQSLTEPVTKSTNGEGDTAEPKQEKFMMTPLVQFIKDKKANKAKESTLSKTSKGHSKHDSKDSKAKKAEPKKVSVIKKESPAAAEKARREKATQDAVKAINKSVADMAGKAAPSKPEAQPAAVKDIASAPSPAKRERERGNISAAARILQRDLGLGPKERRTPRVIKPSLSSESSKSVPSPRPEVLLPSSKPEVPPVTSQPTPPVVVAPAAPTGPRNAKTSSATTTPSQRPAKPPPQSSAGAKSAFLKHANASQGVTEALLSTVFSAFGTLTRCEIDKKKGFGYIDFAETEGLKKAMAASPVQVGNGQVTVLENKTKLATNKSSNAQQQARGHGQQGQQSQALPAANREASPISPTASVPATASLPLVTIAPPPTAPKGGSGATSRGGRGAHGGAGRGSLGVQGRGGRGGVRGRGGGFHGNTNRGAGPTAGTGSSNQSVANQAATASAVAVTTTTGEQTK